jgi:hypothetical protein
MLCILLVSAAMTTASLVSRPVLEPSAGDMRRQASGQLVPPPAGGWFDSKVVGGCAVMYDQSADEWTMFYAGRPASFAADVAPIATGYVGIAKSKDGVSNWRRICADGPLGSCLAPAEDSGDAFDAVHVAVGDVTVDGSDALKMHYFGGGQESSSLGGPNPIRGMRMGISTCTSRDGGLTWCRDGTPGGSGSSEYGKAVLLPTEGAEMFIGWPTVPRGGGVGARDASEADVFFYHACDLTSGGKFAIARATRGDDGQFRPDAAGYVLVAGSPGAFDAGGVSARSVLRHPVDPKRWLMVYEAQSEERKHSIGLAQSEDAGATWARVNGGESIFGPSPEPGAWDDGAVARPYVVFLPHQGNEESSDASRQGWPRARMYYLGRSADGKRQGIGVAESVNGEWTKWRRVLPDEAPPRTTRSRPNSKQRAVSDMFKPDSLGRGTTEGTKW